MSTFNQEIKTTILKKNNNLCVGMDPDLKFLPNGYSKNISGVYDFLNDIIQITYSHCIAYKFNIAFYLSLGKEGIEILEQIIKKIKDISKNEKKFLILDAKVGDIENTAKHYAKAFFETWNFDAITINPLLGIDSIRPFIEYSQKGCIILCLTSNPSNKEFEFYGNIPLYLTIASKIYEWNQINNNVMAVVGATNEKKHLIEIKNILKDIPIFIPGVGSQGGDVKTVKEIFGKNILINVGRSILYASDNKENLELKIKEYLRQINL